jgi:hypothetical protein
MTQKPDSIPNNLKKKSKAEKIATFFTVMAYSTLVFNLMVALEIVALIIPSLMETLALFTMIGGALSLATAFSAERALDNLKSQKEQLETKLGKKNDKDNNHSLETSHDEPEGLQKFSSKFSKAAVGADSIAFFIGALVFFGGLHIIALTITGAAMGVFSFFASSLTLKYGSLEAKTLQAEISDLENREPSQKATINNPYRPPLIVPPLNYQEPSFVDKYTQRPSGDLGLVRT